EDQQQDEEAGEHLPASLLPARVSTGRRRSAAAGTASAPGPAAVPALFAESLIGFRDRAAGVRLGAEERIEAGVLCHAPSSYVCVRRTQRVLGQRAKMCVR